MLLKAAKFFPYPLYNLVFLVATLLPKNKRLWLFGAWQGLAFSDNSKYLFLSVLANEADIQACWLAKDKSLYRDMREQGLPVVYAYSLAGVVAQLRAGLVFYSHRVESEFLPQLIGRSVKRIQLWHGLPMKHIGFDDALQPNAKRNTLFKARLFPFLNERVDLISACSDYDRAIFRRAFLVNPDDVIVAGYPRNDKFFQAGGRSAPQRRSNYRVLYLPTFRGAVGSEFTLLESSGFDYKKYAAELAAMDANLDIKLHPVQRPSAQLAAACQQYSELSLLAVGGDIYSILNDYDLVIIDYSSLYFDLLLLGISFIMAPIDLHNYMQDDRQLYRPYSDYAVHPPCENWPAVFEQIATQLQHRSISDRGEQLCSEFHYYRDAGAAERLIDVVRQRYVGR
ncbi:MAG: CDP-glycerol glycerophosphotransferase family protein [Spongiibacteraceae bacterium]